MERWTAHVNSTDVFSVLLLRSSLGQDKLRVVFINLLRSSSLLGIQILFKEQLPSAPVIFQSFVDSRCNITNLNELTLLYLLRAMMFSFILKNRKPNNKLLFCRVRGETYGFHNQYRKYVANRFFFYLDLIFLSRNVLWCTLFSNQARRGENDIFNYLMNLKM